MLGYNRAACIEIFSEAFQPLVSAIRYISCLYFSQSLVADRAISQITFPKKAIIAAVRNQWSRTSRLQDAGAIDALVFKGRMELEEATQ